MKGGKRKRDSSHPRAGHFIRMKWEEESRPAPFGMTVAVWAMVMSELKL
jgi:hypothetical protein